MASRSIPAQLATAMASPSHPGHAPNAPFSARTTVTATSSSPTCRGSSPGIHPRAKLTTVNGSRRTGKKALTTSTAKTMLTARKTQGTPKYNTVGPAM